jgi:hypothetical protein
MSGHYAGKKARGGAAVSTVERDLWRSQAAQSQATDPHLSRELGNIGAERAECARCRTDVF